LLEDISLSGPQWADPAPPSRPVPDDVALILQSSGTTGQPKLVPRRHRAVASTCRVTIATRALTPADRGLSLARGISSQGANALMTPLFAGASFVGVSGADSDAFPAWLTAYRPTYIATTPAVLRSLAVEDGTTVDALRRWPCRIHATGAPLSPADLDHLEAALGVPILNDYGMTEASAIAIEPYPRLRRVPGTVGLPQCELRLLGADGALVDHGETGEIVVRGPRVFPGYLDDPAANVSAFLPGGWFRTGDLGLLDADGYLHLTDRLGEIINRGGEKIAPREVDDALLAHPAVAEAAVFAVPDRRLGEDIVAAVVFHPGMKTPARELRRWLLLRLAPHKTPRRIWEVDELPRTTTGKVRRGELAARFLQRT
jgi:acyl-coenzyme A synthetase/AMP-(fatty) acid ligase